jgi:ankyrin repeat protein
MGNCQLVSPHTRKACVDKSAQLILRQLTWRCCSPLLVRSTRVRLLPQQKARLFRAVEGGDVGEVESVLAQLGSTVDGSRADLDFRQPPAANTPLHVAAICGHSGVVAVLLAHGASTEVADSEGRSPMFVAALGGQIEIVELLLRAGALVDSKSAAGITPLFASCWRGHSSVARLLLASGADLLVRDDEGRSCWDVAREWNHLDLAQEMEELAMARTRGGSVRQDANGHANGANGHGANTQANSAAVANADALVIEIKSDG